MAPKLKKQNLLEIQAKYSSGVASQFPVYSSDAPDSHGDKTDRPWGHDRFEDRPPRASREDRYATLGARDEELEGDWRAGRPEGRDGRAGVGGRGRDDGRSWNTAEEDCDFGSLRSAPRQELRSDTRRGGEMSARDSGRSGFREVSDSDFTNLRSGPPPPRGPGRDERRDFRRDGPEGRDEYRRPPRVDETRADEDNCWRSAPVSSRLSAPTSAAVERRLSGDSERGATESRPTPAASVAGSRRSDASSTWRSGQDAIAATAVRSNVSYSKALLSAPVVGVASAGGGTSEPTPMESVAKEEPVADKPAKFVPSFRRKEEERKMAEAKAMAERRAAAEAREAEEREKRAAAEAKATAEKEKRAAAEAKATAERRAAAEVKLAEDKRVAAAVGEQQIAAAAPGDSDDNDTKRAYRRVMLEKEKQEREAEEKRRMEAEQVLITEKKLTQSIATIDRGRISFMEGELRKFLTADPPQDVLAQLHPEELKSILPSLICAKLIFEATYVASEAYDDVYSVVSKFKRPLVDLLNGSGIWRHKLLFLIETTKISKELKSPRLTPDWGLLEAVWDSFYFLGIIEEQYFKMWSANTEDATSGRHDAMFQVTTWMSWLMGSLTLPTADGEESEDSEDEEIDSHVPKRVGFR